MFKKRFAVLAITVEATHQTAAAVIPVPRLTVRARRPKAVLAVPVRVPGHGRRRFPDGTVHRVSWTAAG